MRITQSPRYPTPSPARPEPAAYFWTFSPLPPTTNNIYLQGSHGKRILTAEARQWKKTAVDTIRLTSIGLVLPEQPLALHVRYFPANHQRWDTDGRHKLLVDAFAEAFGIDDRGERIPYVSLQRMEPRKGIARVELAVEPYAHWLTRAGGGWPANEGDR